MKRPEPSAFEAILESLAAYEETVLRAPRMSLPGPKIDTGPPIAMDSLTGGHKVEDALIFEGEIGRGGMGTVHLAQQRSVGRQVAVKRIRESLGHNADYTRALVREGWVMATLEHPNIPPVHDVMFDDDGSPLVLLKCIEGDEWGNLMHEAEIVRHRNQEDLLPWNLSVLDSVCNAVSYAHSKGVVHRDLKPENVMIGSFGEVYVLDWGIAVTLTRDPEGRLPYVGDSVQPAGTPCFMAPELLAPDPSDVDARTDVYLIGAMLYEVLTGRPPHLFKTMNDIVESILKSEPEFPEDTPAALAAVCTKAMQADRDDRYASVEELRQALRLYLKRRASELLALEGEGRLRNLQLLAETAPGEERASQMSVLYNECCFAFRQALASCPDLQLPQEGLIDAAQLMARCALKEGHLDAARAFLGELQNPDQALVAELAARTSEVQKRSARLLELERHQDTSIGRGRTVMLSAGVAAAVTAGAAVAEVLKGTIYDSHLVFVVWQGVILAGFLAVYPYLGLQRTQHNRVIKLLFATAVSVSIVATIGAWLAGLPTDATHLLMAVGWTSCTTAAALMMGWIYLPAALMSVAIVCIIALYPGSANWATAGFIGAVLINAAAVHLLGISPRARITPREP